MRILPGLRAVVLAGILALPGLVAADKPPMELPLRPHPEHKSDRLTPVEAAARELKGNGLHAGQVNVLHNGSSAGKPSSADFLLGAALALDEYFEREESFPESAEDLNSSGYLEPGWAEAGYKVVSFVPGGALPTGDSVAYIPEPAGDAKLICADPAHCPWKMRQYTEYALMVNAAELAGWGVKTPKALCLWAKPFNGVGLQEVIYINKENPGKCACLKCGE